MSIKVHKKLNLIHALLNLFRQLFIEKILCHYLILFTNHELKTSLERSFSMLIRNTICKELVTFHRSIMNNNCTYALVLLWFSLGDNQKENQYTEKGFKTLPT